MRALKKQLKDEHGAIVVEATLSLSTFMFAIVTILTIINICLAQAKVGTTICFISEDISRLSYLYSLSGLKGVKDEGAKKGADAGQAINDLQDAFGSMDVGKAANTISKFSEDDMQESLAYFVGNKAIEGLTDKGIIAKICDVSAKSHLQNKDMDGSAYLKFLGVVGAGGGSTGLDFSESRYCASDDGNSDIIIVVAKYKVHVIKLLGFDFEFSFKQCAPTKIWDAPKDNGGS